MRQRNPSRASVVGLAAVVLAVLIAQVSVAGDPDGSRIDRLERQVRELRDQLGARAEVAKKKRKKPKRGPAGPAGATGPRGPQGPQGPGAGGVQLGWILTADLPSPGTSRSYAPLGDGAGAGAAGGSITPGAAVVVRDLAVEITLAPGIGARWSFVLQGESTLLELTCSIVSAAATKCDSGSQAFTNPAGGDLRLIVLDDGSVPATRPFIRYAYRIGPA